jgi:anaerobic selenocysteine-containing dehydrogenase
MCACRRGIKVHFANGRIRYIEGNRKHPVNPGPPASYSNIRRRGLPTRCCEWGSAGLTEFREIEWDEALHIACQWLARVRQSDAKRLAFFTGRDRSQALAGYWARQFGTPNYAAHGGLCSAPLSAGAALGSAASQAAVQGRKAIHARPGPP